MPSYRTSKRSLFLHWMPALLGVAVIMAESTEVMKAENTSRWLYPLWSGLFGAVDADRWGQIHLMIRKTGHFLGYGLVSLAFHHGWRYTLADPWGRNVLTLRRRAAGLAVVCTLALASADEIHQLFLPGRTSSIYDVMIDVLGGIAAQLLLFGGLSLFSRPRRREIAPHVGVM